MRRIRVVASAALIALALAGSACTSTGNESGGGAGDAAAAATEPASFAVSLTDQLKIDPAMIDAPSNTPLTFDVTNTGAGQHSFAIEAGDQTYQTPLLDGGGTATLEVPGLPVGEYTMTYDLDTPNYSNRVPEKSYQLDYWTMTDPIGQGRRATAAVPAMAVILAADRPRTQRRLP